MLTALLDSRPVRTGSYRLQRIVLHPKARAVAARIAAGLRPRAAGAPSALRTDGLLELGAALETRQIAEIKAHLGDRAMFDPYERQLGRFRASAAPAAARLGMVDQQHLLAAPHLLELANRPDILALAAGLLGARPTLTDFLAWRSFAGRDGPRHAQLFHRDAADWRVCKLFVYLTDVDVDSGPHVYARGTAGSPLLTGIGRLSEAEVRARFSDLAVLTGPAGTAFMSDPRGIHRAAAPVRRDRLVFEATYALLPQPDFTFVPRPPRRIRLPATRLSRIDPWVSRRFVEPTPAP